MLYRKIFVKDRDQLLSFCKDIDMWLKLERDVNSFGLPKVKLRTIIDSLTSRVMFPELMFIRELVFLSNGHQYMGERERKITKILLLLRKQGRVSNCL